MSDPFWTAVEDYLAEVRRSGGTQEVIDLTLQYFPDQHYKDGAADAFFPGSGGDDQLYDALEDAGWKFLVVEAEYSFTAKAPDKTVLKYVEGDIYRKEN